MIKLITRLRKEKLSEDFNEAIEVVAEIRKYVTIFYYPEKKKYALELKDYKVDEYENIYVNYLKEIGIVDIEVIDLAYEIVDIFISESSFETLLTFLHMRSN